jgi:hypothetical protein
VFGVYKFYPPEVGERQSGDIIEVRANDLDCEHRLPKKTAYLVKGKDIPVTGHGGP